MANMRSTCVCTCNTSKATFSLNEAMGHVGEPRHYNCPPRFVCKVMVFSEHHVCTWLCKAQQIAGQHGTINRSLQGTLHRGRTKKSMAACTRAHASERARQVFDCIWFQSPRQCILLLLHHWTRNNFPPPVQRSNMQGQTDIQDKQP